MVLAVVPAAAVVVVPLEPLVVEAFAAVDAVVPLPVVLLPEVVPPVAVVAAPVFDCDETPEVADRVVGEFFDTVDATIAPPVDDDPLPGTGKPVLAAERVTGALVGEDGRLRTALTMMSLNCSVVVSRPSVSMGSWKACVRDAGCCPSAPGAASTFWLWRALATSVAVMPSDASFCGSSQARTL
jgi:hypothetical protein